MNVQGFDFEGPREKREARSFEPPPWEREAFDELDRRRASEREAQELLRTADRATRSTQADSVQQEQQAPDEQEIDWMLASLKAEEPKARDLSSVGVAVGVVIALLGVGLVATAATQLRGLGGAKGFGGQFAGGLAVFGLFFMGIGGWLVFRTLRQRGVL